MDKNYLFDLPRDVWRVILQNLSFLSLIRLVTVSSLWRELVYESVTSFEIESQEMPAEWMEYAPDYANQLNGYENADLTDAALTRFRSLKRLRVVRPSGDKSLLTDAGLKGLLGLETLFLLGNPPQLPTKDSVA
jgi:hypothetical protein